MSVGGDFFRFADGELTEIDIALADPLTVADSWLVSDGAVRALPRHLARFANSITEPVTRSQLETFFQRVLESIPSQGDWFPRLEYREDQPLGQRLFLRLRPAPERTETCTLWTYDQGDPRTQVQIKGPDLSICQKLRRAANLHGADEAVLTTEDGFISDGALSAIVWWEGDTLCAPDQTTPWLPSITRQLVFELASQAGYSTAEVRRRPLDLAGCEVWSLSALQGIRGVTSWQDVNVAEPRLLRPFRKRLALISEAISEASDFHV